MDSLGGKSLALMIACVSPASSAIDETLSTLRSKLAEQNIEVDQFPSLDTVNTPPSSATKRVRHSSQRPKSREKIPSELKGMEKYFSTGSSKDLAKELSGLSVFGNFQDHAQQNDSDSLAMDGSRCSLFPSESNRRSHTGSNGWDSCDNSVDFNVTPRVYSEPRCLRSSNEPNSLLGMYRGLANSKPKGLQHRRNRVSVDHLGGSRVRLRKGGGKSDKQDPRFQGSITVNQTAFLKRLLDLNLSPVHDDIVNY